MNDKPREWMWEVNGVGGIEKLTGHMFKPHEKIHVIEYFAFAFIKARYEARLANLYKREKQINQLKAKSAKLVEALTEIRNERKSFEACPSIAKRAIAEYESDLVKSSQIEPNSSNDSKIKWEIDDIIRDAGEAEYNPG